MAAKNNIDVRPDWNNWPRYRDKIIARFVQGDILDILAPRAGNPPNSPRFTFICGAWYLKGDPTPYAPFDMFKDFTKTQSKGNLILLDCLSPSIYDQVISCNTVRDKWSRLHQLYKEYLEVSRADAAASPPVPEIISQAIPASIPPRTHKKANDFLLENLRRYPKYGEQQGGSADASHPSIIEHLTYMNVLYEGLVSRNAHITDGEFISMIHETFSRLPMIQALVTSLNNQAKKQGRPNVPIPQLIDGIADYEEALGKDKLTLTLQE